MQRFYIAPAALAVALLAITVGCGGGSASPFVGPTPIPAAQSTIAPLSTSSTTTVNFGSVSGGGTTVSSASITLPQVNVASNASVTLSATNPTGVPKPSAHSAQIARPNTLGIPVTALAYFTVAFSATVTISSSPAFSVTLPAAPGGNAYVAVYDPSGAIGPGWIEVSGPISGANSTLSFASSALSPPLTLTAGTQYVFAIVTSSEVIPTPGPTATPTSTPTATPSPSPIVPSVTSITFPTSSSATPCPTACTTQFTVSEAGYTGAFHALSSNPSVATIAIVTSGTFEVTAMNTGTATITVSDDNGQSLTIPVTITSGITVQPQRHQ